MQGSVKRERDRSRCLNTRLHALLLLQTLSLTDLPRGARAPQAHEHPACSNHLPLLPLRLDFLGTTTVSSISPHKRENWFGSHNVAHSSLNLTTLLNISLKAPGLTLTQPELSLANPPRPKKPLSTSAAGAQRRALCSQPCTVTQDKQITKPNLDSKSVLFNNWLPTNFQNTLKK